MTRRLAWSCKAAARSAAIRPACTRRWRPPTICRIGSRGSPSARSMRRSSPAMRRRIASIACAASGRRSPLRPCCGRTRAEPWLPGNEWASAAMAIAFGQPGFFGPHPRAWPPSDKCTSYYSTSALKATLERLVDFDRINAGKDMRLSVGAVNVRTGDFAYFDSSDMTIRPEHVMASGALPPGFPPVEIDGEQYWDGGLFSNTPLQYMVDYYPRRSRLIFQVDLFPARSRKHPANLDEVHERDKDIRYSSRTRLTTSMLCERHDVRHMINELHKL